MIQESLEDFRKRYKGTFLFLDIKNKRHLVRYETDNEEDFSFFSNDYGDILVDEATARESISFYFPPTGLYNIENGAHFFARVPARQWKRAPCHDNTSITPILKEIGLHFSNLTLSPSNVDLIFDPAYPPSLEDAIREKKMISVALNKNFAISDIHTEDKNKKLLWFQTSPIGVVDPETWTIDVKYHPFYQEVLDFVRKQEYKWTVKRS